MNVIYSLKLNTVLLIILLFTLLTNFFYPSPLIIIVSTLSTLLVVVVALTNLINKRITVDQLAAIALTVSFFHQEWLSIAFINLMIISARIFGIYTENKAKNTIQSLLKLRPESVKLKQNGVIKIVPIERLHPGDLVIIETGERIPIDGIVVSGQADIDQSTLTGESLPVFAETGHRVLSSTLNLSGSLVVRAEKVGADTTFQKIINLVESAQNNKIRFQTITEKFAAWYIVISLVSALFIYLISSNLNLVLSFLLVTCADDIAVAVPLAYWAGIAIAAKNGIIIKGGNYLEVLSRVTMLITDKTGTLTKAKLHVVNVMPLLSKYSPDKVLFYAAIAESVSDHPLAKAVIKDIHRHQIKYPMPSNFKEYPGGGVSARYRQSSILVGSQHFFVKQRISLNNNAVTEIEKLEKQGDSIILVACNKKIIGLIALEDEIKPEVSETIKKLQKNGIKRLVLLTGDNEYAANTIAQKIGITEVYANCKPEDKLNFIQNNISLDHKIAYIGDGVNDSATLAQADVGFAMGVIGADSAIESADIAIMDDNFSRVNTAITLAKTTKTIVKQDFAIWAVVNMVGIYLAFSGRINPPQAALFNFVTDFFPLLNSLRLFTSRFKTL